LLAIGEAWTLSTVLRPSEAADASWERSGQNGFLIGGAAGANKP
jgi:hypothetical protein